MGTIPSYDPAPTPLDPADQFYLEHGASSDRGKRATVQMLLDKVDAVPHTFTGSVRHSLAPSTASKSVGSTDSGTIPSTIIDASSPEYLINAGYVYLLCGNLVPGTTPPIRFLVFSPGAAKSVGFTSFASTVYTASTGAAATAHTPGGGDFAIAGVLIDVVWNGSNIFATVLMQ